MAKRKSSSRKSVRPSGQVVVHSFLSRVLQDNPLRDPIERNVYVYLPPGYSQKKTARYPTLLALAGFTGTGAMLFNGDPMSEDLKTRLDRLIQSRACPPVIVAAPDCFTRLGGSQYINSSAVGAYEDYLVEEIIPFVQKTYRVSRWGVFGKSSGGYGAMVLAMRHPEIFQAVANHSGDAGFELCYLPEMAAALDSFRKAGGPAKWLDRFWQDANRRRNKHFKALLILAMAAHYSPNPRSPHSGIDFPFDLQSGRFLPEVWERWRNWDPIVMARRYREALKQLRLIYIDCGGADEFGLHWGARALTAELKRAGVAPHYEEFEDGHSGISYRYDVSLPLLAKSLKG